MATPEPPRLPTPRTASRRAIDPGDDEDETPQPSMKRRDETRQTGTIVQATTYLENKMHNMNLDLTARIDRIDDKLDSIIETLQSRPPANNNSTADQRGASRYPNDLLFTNNGATVSLEPQVVVTAKSDFKIKRKDLRVFDPDAEDVKNSGVLIEGRNIIFTNVYSFEQRMLLFIEVEPEQQC
jgi:hypothetical protein